MLQELHAPASYDSPRQVPWTLRDALFGIALVVAGSVFTVLLLSWLRPGGGSGGGEPLVSLAIGLVPILMVAAAWLFGVRKYRSSWRRLGFARPRGRRSVILPWLALFLSLLFASLYLAVVTRLGLDLAIPEPIPTEVLGDGILRAVNVAIIVIAGPLAEEVFFRGFLLAALVRKLSALQASAVGSAIFAASHGSVGILVPFFVSGMLLSWLYLRTRSIWPPFTAHAAQNLIAVYAISSAL